MPLPSSLPPGQPPAPRRASRRPRAGLTLTETLIGLAITAVALGSAVPGFESARERRQLEGLAAQLETDLADARASAVAMNRTLRIGFGRDADGGSCYVVHSGSAGQCSCGARGPVCQGGALAVRHVHLDGSAGVRIATNVAAMAFSPDLGTVTPTGTLRVEARDGRALHQVVNVMGRVRTCSPAAAVPGYRAC